MIFPIASEYTCNFVPDCTAALHRLSCHPMGSHHKSLFRSRGSGIHKQCRTRAARPAAFTLHTKRVEQLIIADDDLHRLIWPQTVGKNRLADLAWIIRPLIAVSDKVRRRHPFNNKSIRGTGLSGNDIDGYV